MPRHVLPASLLCVLLLGHAAPGQGGRLERVRKEVRPEPAAPPAHLRQTHSPQRRVDEDDESPLAWILGIFFAPDDDPACDFVSRPHEEGIDASPLVGPIAYVLFSPFTVPCTLVKDRWDDGQYFPPFPYRKRYPGYSTLHPRMGEEIAGFWGDTRIRTTSVQATLENGNDFSGLNRVGGMFLLDSTSRLGILARWDWFHERLGGGEGDNLLLGDINATLTFARTHWIQMRTGMGLRWLADCGRADFGFNFHYGADLFPVRPVVISSSLDAGTVGDAGFLRLRGTMGIVRRHVEVFGGYDYISIGGVELQGPMAGVRLWY